MLDRKTIVATKAVTQTFSHVLRAVYFGSLGGLAAYDMDDVRRHSARHRRDLATPDVIERMTDHGFRQWTRAVIYVISGVYLVGAGVLLWR